MKPSSYEETNNVIPAKEHAQITNISEASHYSKSNKKAKDSYEEHMEAKQQEDNLKEPWDD